MHPSQHARLNPERLALVVADTGEQLTYGELESASNQAAQYFRSVGLAPGDRVGLMLANSRWYAVLYWGAQRAGLMVAPLSTHLKAAEVSYILNDCGARLLVADSELGDAAREILRDAKQQVASLEHVCDIATGPDAVGQGWIETVSAQPCTPLSDEISGYYLIYSSGTTGRPKGVVLPFEAGPIERPGQTEQISMARLQQYSPVVTFNGGPLYHAAPLVSMLVTHRCGGTAVIMRKFDAEGALRAIEKWKVTYAQFVPTMFIRMLALPEKLRNSFDLSSLQCVIHSAAPCPVAVKRQMLEWLGPIVHEYYSGSEAVGMCQIGPEEWLEKPGSVGRPVWGTIRVCDDDGHLLPPNTDGQVYFESDRTIEYLNDPDKTRSARHPAHENWLSMGDVGHVDEDGYLFLTDRKNFMIISGGVNIYPQAIENHLVMHPAVYDVAVIGVPNAEYGEEVKAVVQLEKGFQADPEMVAELTAYCRDHLSHVSCPRSFDFIDELPRLQSGKLAKHLLRDRYRDGSAA